MPIKRTEPRQALAAHARERLWHAEHRERVQAAAQARMQADPEYLRLMHAQEAPARTIATPPDHTALRQRAERAERRTAGWHRLAALLAVACCPLVLAGCDRSYQRAMHDVRSMAGGCKDNTTRTLRTDGPGKRTMVITCVPQGEASR